MHIARAALLLLALTGCSQSSVPAAQEAVPAELVPVIVTVREAVQDAAPLPSPAEPTANPAVPLATALIVRWEVTSPAYYDRRLQGVICPGGASGPTWGLGWDGGHQTERDNRTAWSQHPHVDRLARTAGHSGEARCRASRGQLLDVLHRLGCLRHGRPAIPRKHHSGPHHQGRLPLSGRNHLHAAQRTVPDFLTRHP